MIEEERAGEPGAVASQVEPLYRAAVRIGTQSGVAGLLAGLAATLAIVLVGEGFKPELILLVGFAFTGLTALLTLLEELGQRRGLSLGAYLALLLAGGSLGFLVAVGSAAWGMMVVLNQQSPFEATRRLLDLLVGFLANSEAWSTALAIAFALVVVGWIRVATASPGVRAAAGVAGGVALMVGLYFSGDLRPGREMEIVFVMFATSTAATCGLVLGERLEERLHAGYQARLDRD